MSLPLPSVITFEQLVAAIKGIIFLFVFNLGEFIIISFCTTQETYTDTKICLTSLTRAKCGTRSTLCWKIPNISGSTKLFGL